jgi:hypothetical protein
MADGPTQLTLNLADEIQLLYPIEPDWPEVDNDTLAALVDDFASEPSCATTALGLLAARKDARANQLAHWLIAHEQADQWLKEAAHDVLDGK